MVNFVERIFNSHFDKWKSTIHAFQNFFDVFVNPSVKEIKEVAYASKVKGLQGYFRFIADNKEKKVYVFSIDIIHHTVFQKIYLPQDYKRYMTGEADFNKGKPIMIGVTALATTESGEVIEKDWLWVNRYVNVSIFLKQFKKGDKWHDTYLDYEIFVNPSKAEIKNVSEFSPGTTGATRDDFRFLAEKQTKKLYIFSDYFLHQTASRFLHLIYSGNAINFNSMMVLNGVGSYNRGRPTVTVINSQTLKSADEDFKKVWLRAEGVWSWIDKYIKLTGVL